MIVICSGAAAILAGVAIFAIALHRKNDVTIEAFLSHMRHLTASGKEALEKASEPLPDCIAITKDDAMTVFYNSRLNLKIANRARLCEPADIELQAMFETLLEDHRKLRWLFIITAIELFVGKLGLGFVPMYARLLLGTYAEELELLSQISDKCGPLEGNAIRAIL